MVLRFRLNTICICSLKNNNITNCDYCNTGYVQRYTEFEKYSEIQAICNCRITARAVIWFTSYFLNLSIFLLMALGGLPENPGSWVLKP